MTQDDFKIKQSKNLDLTRKDPIDTEVNITRQLTGANKHNPDSLNDFGIKKARLPKGVKSGWPSDE